MVLSSTKEENKSYKGDLAFFYMELLFKYLIQFLYSLLRKPDLYPQILQVKKFTLIVFPISTHVQSQLSNLTL